MQAVKRLTTYAAFVTCCVERGVAQGARSVVSLWRLIALFDVFNANVTELKTTS